MGTLPLVAEVRKTLTDQKEVNVLAIIAGVLFVLWLLGFVAFHVTTGFIHVVLVLAAIMLILHLVRGRSAV